MSNHTNDFLLLCKDRNFAEAVHALYYLPLNYKLMVLQDAAMPGADDSSWLDTISLKGRVSFEKSDDTHPAANAIISSDDDSAVTKTQSSPYVIVSETAGSDIQIDGPHGFTVRSNSPEALATAVLKLSRATA
jgi:hypothetical protein